MDLGREVAGEVTRLESVRYLQGALGHAVWSSLFLLFGGLLWGFGYGLFAVVSIAVAFLVSANGLSIWAWDRLRVHFAARAAPPEETGSTRELTAGSLSPEARVQMQAGAVMTLALVALLALGRVALGLLGPRTVAYVCVAGLGVGNITALANAVRTSSADATERE
jgi:hypothetical protein